MDGREAFSKAQAEKPDLIITDLKMPRMSGMEMMTALRKAGNNVPVILTTFYGSEQTAIQAFRLGARDYLVKPYDMEDMLESVERALIEVRLRRETNDLKEGAEVRRHLEGRVRQLNSLCGIGKALNAIHDPDGVMRVAVDAAIYLTGANRGQLFLANPGSGHLELCAVRGPAEQRAKSVRQVGTDLIAVRASQAGQAVLAERSDGAEKIPCLAVPLRTEQGTVGVLSIDAKPAHTLDENDGYQMGILANFAAVALKNAQLIASLQNGISASPDQPDSVPEPTLLPGMIDSVAEAQRLSGELRDLADAAQVFADKLRSQTDQLGGLADPA
jgi:two-component system NtrC family sensor kinase